MVKKISLGDKFGYLTVIEDLGVYKKEGTSQRRHYFKCKCSCGNEKTVNKSDMTNGKILSCGCYHSKITIKRNRRYNDYYIVNDTVIVKFSNSDKYFLCDLEDLNYIKNHSWYEDKHGYAMSNINRKKIFFHRLILNAQKGEEVDHIFQISKGVCDNRKNNLRICSHQKNMENVSLYKNNTSGYAGVIYDKSCGKWRANISVKGKCKYLGKFDDINDAIKARKKGEEKYRD